MKILSADIVASAVDPPGWPSEDIPEVAVMGRSNVGKSSLLNKMVNRRQLARTSSTPGKTRLLHFFEIETPGQKLRLVDLPGYGYAKVSVSERKRWRTMIETYLGGRPNLRAALLLQDVRRTPGEEELDLSAWLGQRNVPVVVALTKLDKLKAKEKVKILRGLEAAIPVQADWRIQTSAKTGAGVDRLWQVLRALL